MVKRRAGAAGPLRVIGSEGYTGSELSQKGCGNPGSECHTVPTGLTAAERSARDEKEVPFMTTSIKADQNTKMGIVTDVKQELRKANALKINYSTRKKVQ